jgi:hypothetical protein
VPKDTVVRLIQPGAFDDQLTAVLRNGARALLAQAVEAEVAGFLDKHAASMRNARPRTAAPASCATAICPSAR